MELRHEALKAVLEEVPEEGRSRLLPVLKGLEVVLERLEGLTSGLSEARAVMAQHPPGLCEDPECSPCANARAVYGEAVWRRARMAQAQDLRTACEWDGPEAVRAWRRVLQALEAWERAGRPRPEVILEG